MVRQRGENGKRSNHKVSIETRSRTLPDMETMRRLAVSFENNFQLIDAWFTGGLIWSIVLASKWTAGRAIDRCGS